MRWFEPVSVDDTIAYERSKYRDTIFPLMIPRWPPMHSNDGWDGVADERDQKILEALTCHIVRGLPTSNS